MAGRANGPVAGARSSWKTSPERLFKDNVKAGRIPSKFNTWEEAEKAFLDAVDGGLSPEEARQKLGLTYTNVNGQPYFNPTTDSRTNTTRGLNTRAVAEDLHPQAEDHIRRIRGEDAAQQARIEAGDEWGDNKTKKSDKYKGSDNIGPNYVQDARTDAEGVRDDLREKFGKGNPLDQGKQIHRGHGHAAKGTTPGSNGGINRSNLMPEWGPLNVGHSNDPRFNEDVMWDLNMSSTGEQAYWDGILESEGLTINPTSKRQPGDYMAGDEYLREVKGSKGPMNYEVGPAIERGNVTPDSIPARERRRAELVAQGLITDPKAQANSQSTLLDTTTAESRSGPVRTVRQPDAVTVQDMTRKPNGNLPRSGLRRAAKLAPLAGLAIAFGNAAQAAQQGNYMDAAGHLIEGAVGEVPVVGDVAVETAQGSPAADGTLQGAQRTALQVQQSRAQKPSQYGYHGPDVPQAPKPKPTYQQNREKLNRARRRNR